MKLFVLLAILFSLPCFSHEARNHDHEAYLIHTCDLEVFKKHLDKKLGEIYDEYYGDLRPDAVAFYFTNMMLHQRRVIDYTCYIERDENKKRKYGSLENENTTDEWYKEITKKYNFEHLFPYTPLGQIYSLSSSISDRETPDLILLDN